MKYQIEVTETRRRVFEVEADEAGEAVKRVAEDYGDGWIRLDEKDYVGFSIKEYKGEGAK